MPRRASPARRPASDALGHVRRPPYLRLCRLLPALVSPLFLPLMSLFSILLPLILTLRSCILRQPGARQPPARLIDDPGIMMILSPVVPGEKHPSPPPWQPVRQQRGGDIRRSDGQALTARAGHVIPSAVTSPHDWRAHGLPQGLQGPQAVQREPHRGRSTVTRRMSSRAGVPPSPLLCLAFKRVVPGSVNRAW
jgi:hypothetical protein